MTKILCPFVEEVDEQLNVCLHSLGKKFTWKRGLIFTRINVKISMIDRDKLTRDKNVCAAEIRLLDIFHLPL